jgi:Xaa-Pro dipeptidase
MGAESATELLNRSRALEFMRRHQIDVLLATTPPNVTYLTGHIGRASASSVAPTTYGLFAAGDGTRGLVIGGADVASFASRPGSADSVRSYGGVAVHSAVPNGYVPAPAVHVGVPDGYAPDGDEATRFFDLGWGDRLAGSSPIDALRAVVSDLAVERSRVAVDQPPGAPVLDVLRTAFDGWELVPAINLFRMIRIVKTSAELERMRRAAQLNEDSINAAFAEFEVGATEAEVAGAWRAHMARGGGTSDWCFVGANERSAWFLPPGDRSLRRGDTFVYDCGLFLDGYNSDTGCCGAVGEPSALHRRRFDAIAAGVEAGIAIVCEGVIGSTIYNTVVDTARRSGFPEFNPFFVGHTLGLETRDLPLAWTPRVSLDDPFLPENTDMPLPAGTVLNVEGPFGLLGEAGYFIERTIVVTPEGHDALIRQERPFRLLGATA